MTKKELKYFLKLYPTIEKAIENKVSKIEILIYGRKKKIEIPLWVHKLTDIFTQIIESEDNSLVSHIIEKAYKRGEDDRKVILRLPISESGYYRLKRRIEEKIYELYIVDGDVNQEEILNNKIVD